MKLKKNHILIDFKKKLDLCGGYAANLFCRDNTIIKFPLLDTSEIWVFQAIFSNCANLEEVAPIDFRKGTDFYSTFHACPKLKSVPPILCEKGGNMGYLFYGDTALETIEKINFTGARNLGGAFSYCSNLKNIAFVGTIPISLSVNQSPHLTDETIQSIINALKDLNGQTAQKIQWHTDVLLKLTDEQITTIKTKNWTVG